MTSTPTRMSWFRAATLGRMLTRTVPERSFEVIRFPHCPDAQPEKKYINKMLTEGKDHEAPEMVY